MPGGGFSLFLSLGRGLGQGSPLSPGGLKPSLRRTQLPAELDYPPQRWRPDEVVLMRSVAGAYEVLAAWPWA